MAEELDQVYWELDDQAVDLSGWDAHADLLGYTRATGDLPERQCRRAVQEAILKGWLPDGRPFWEGKLAADCLVVDGVGTIDAAGYQDDAEKATGRLPFQSRDPSLWLPRNGPPWNVAESGQHFQVQQRGSDLVWNLDQDLAVTNTEHNSIVFAAPKAPNGFSRIAFNWRSRNATTLFVLRLYRAAWPNDPSTQTGGNISLNATSGAVNHDIAGGAAHDQIMIQLIAVSNAASINAYWVQIYDLRVNGIVPFASGDTFTLDETVKDVGARLGWDTLAVDLGTLNVLPLDHQSGSWRDLLGYLGVLSDGFIRILDDGGSGPRVEAMPFSDTERYSVTLARDARPELRALRKYNRVKVAYDSTGGLPAEVERTAADIGEIDTLPSGTVSRLEYELADPQPNATLATAVADALLGAHLRPRFAGSIPFVAARGRAGQRENMTVLPGAVFDISDWGPAQAQEVRIVGMDWAEGEPPIAHAEVLDLAAGMAARASISASRAGGRADISDIEREADFAEAMAVREGWLAGQELAGERRQWRKAKRRAFREHTRKTSLGGHRVTAKEKKERRRWRRQNPKP